MLVTKNDLRLLPQVPFTKTWKPYPHFAVSDMTERVLSYQDIRIVNVKYELTKNQQNMFSVYFIEHELSNYRYMLGVRNSTDKSFSLGVCSGCTVVVCSNLCFDGSFKIVNIHNQTLTEERIYSMLLDATHEMMVKSNKTIEWLEALKTIRWEAQRFKAAVLDILLKRIVPPAMLHQFAVNVAEERRVNKDTTPYVLQNAVTWFYRDRSFQLQYSKVNRVNEYLRKIL